MYLIYLNLVNVSHVIICVSGLYVVNVIKINEWNEVWIRTEAEGTHEEVHEVHGAHEAHEVKGVKRVTDTDVGGMDIVTDGEVFNLEMNIMMEGKDNLIDILETPVIGFVGHPWKIVVKNLNH